MKTTKVSGIYRITNKLNGKFYIGSAVNLTRRFSDHRYLARKNQHHNAHFQSAWNKYGEDNFQFSVEEFVSIDNLFEREQFYLDILRPYDQQVGYNKSKSAITCFGISRKDPISVAKYRVAALKRYETYTQPSGENSPNSILSQNLVDEMIVSFSTGSLTQKEISVKYGISRGHVCAIMAGEYWKNDNFIYPIEWPKRSDLVLEKNLELIERLLQEGTSITTIAKTIGCCRKGLSKNLKVKGIL